MEAFGVGILIVMMIFFGISSLASAYEASQRWKRDLEEAEEHFERQLRKRPWDREE